MNFEKHFFIKKLNNQNKVKMKAIILFLCLNKNYDLIQYWQCFIQYQLYINMI